MDEATYLLSIPADKAMLLKAIAELDLSKMITKTMAEVEAMASE